MTSDGKKLLTFNLKRSIWITLYRYVVKELHFTQLAEIETKQDALHDYDLHADGNRAALFGSSTELITLELSPHSSYLSKFPYNIASWPITLSKPLSKFIERVNLKKIYANCDAMDSQALALEPVYVDYYSVQPSPPKIIHASWSSKPLSNGQALLATLTSYGAFKLLTKEQQSALWRQELFDVNATIAVQILPPLAIQPEKIKNFQDFKAYIDHYWITAFTWQDASASGEEHKLYVGTAEGNILCLTLSACAQELLQYQCTPTDMGRICWISHTKDLLLVGNSQGMVKIYKCPAGDDNGGAGGGLQFVECLWSKADRMGIQKAELTYCEESQRYFAVFTKAAHLLAFCLLPDGKKSGSLIEYLGGMKLTALTMLSARQFIVTSMTSMLLHLELTEDPIGGKLLIDRRSVTTSFDSINYQLLGVGTSQHKSLLTFVRFRNKEIHTQHTHITRNSTFISVGKLNTHDSLEQLCATPIRDMMEYVEYLSAVRLEIVNELNLAYYIDFQPLQAQFLDLQKTDDGTLQCLQIKYLLTESLLLLHHDKLNKSFVPEHCRTNMELLQPAIELVHILLRLRYLATIESPLSTFQQRAIACMRRRYTYDVEKLKTLGKNQVVSMQQAIDRFVEVLTEEMYVESDRLPSTSSSASAAEEVSTLEHYCTVSFIELPPSLDQRYCVQCGRHALLDVTHLQQLFSPQELIRCTFCRSHFVCEYVSSIPMET